MGGLALAAAERFTEQALGPAPLHGRSNLPAGGQAQAAVSAAVLEGDDHQQRPIHPLALAEDAAHIGGRVDPVSGTQGLATAPQPGPARLRRACAPSGAAASGPAVRPWSSCEPGTHESSFACDCSAGKSASCWLPLARRAPTMGRLDSRQTPSLAWGRADCQTRSGQRPADALSCDVFSCYFCRCRGRAAPASTGLPREPLFHRC